MPERFSRIHECRVVQLGGAALLIRFPSGREEWIADSLIHDDSEVHRGTPGASGDLILASWKVEQLQRQVGKRPAIDTKNLRPRRRRKARAA